MVELDVRIDGGDVFVGGEMIRCILIFTNTGKETQTIAWASAQLHCQLIARTQIVKLNEKEVLRSPVTDTAFFPNRGEKGVSLFETPSKVLLCNITIRPSEIKKVSYYEEIPTKGPPSYAGRFVRYTYKLTVGAQKPNCPAQIIRIPIRVITIPSRLLRPQLTSPQNSNPFLNTEECQSLTELGLEAIAGEAGRRTNASYTLTSSGDIIGRIVIPRLSYRLGDEVTTILDCSNSTHQVLQVTATLMCIETIQEACVQPNSTSSKPSMNVVVSREIRGCTNSLITHFTLPIPTGQTQSFTNDIVNVTWEVQFQLLISKASWSSTHSITQSVGPALGVAEIWKGPLPQKAETVHWSLPLSILPSINVDTLLTQRQRIVL